MGYKTPIKTLRACTIHETPRNIDWREALDENGEGWQSWQTEECSECGRTVLVDFTGYAACKCGADVEHYDSGPMMNYWYPCPIDDYEEAAMALDGLPLCVVEIDGEMGIALTGGGMDLSWEICEAYMRLGYLPPVHFRLPMMCGRGTSKRDRWIIAGMREALRIARLHVNNSLADLKRTVAWCKGYAQERKEREERERQERVQESAQA